MAEYRRIKSSTLRILGDNARRLGKVYKDLSPGEMIAILESIDEKKVLGENQFAYSVCAVNVDFNADAFNFQIGATAALTE